MKIMDEWKHAFKTDNEYQGMKAVLQHIIWDLKFKKRFLIPLEYSNTVCANTI